MNCYKATNHQYLTHSHTTNLDQTKLKAFADNKLNAAKMIISVFDRVENIVRKGEISCKSNFSFSHNVFKRLLSQAYQKVSLCGNGLKNKIPSYQTTGIDGWEQYCCKCLYNSIALTHPYVDFSSTLLSLWLSKAYRVDQRSVSMFCEGWFQYELTTTANMAVEGALTFLPRNKISALSKLRAFADDKVGWNVGICPYRWPFRSWDENFTKVLKTLPYPLKTFLILWFLVTDDLYCIFK